MNRDDDREVMEKREAQEEVGQDFNLMDEWMKPLVLCSHKVVVKSGIYDPVELEAIACLTREYGEAEKECDQCEEEREEEKPKRGKKGKRERDDY